MGDEKDLLMNKKLITITAALALAGCTVSIVESKFIAQDESVIQYSNSFVQDLNSRVPQHKVKPIKATAKDDVVLNGLFLDAAASNEAILFIPGNGMSIEKAAKKALVELAQYNQDIVIFDRRGLGATAGSATIANQISDANLSFDYVKHQLHASKITVHGYSLGSFIAAQLAKAKPVDALVLQGGATNVDDWIDEMMPWYTKPFLNLKVEEAFYRVDTQQVLSDEYKGPLLLIAGGEDKQTPAVLSHKLFAASNSKNKQLVVAEKAGHGEMFESEKVQRAYRNFLHK